MIEGFYTTSKDKRAGGEVWNRDAPAKSRTEKQTDTNLAVEVMLDALGPEQPGQVYLLSDDRDLMPVVFALLERLPASIPVVILLPSEAEDKNKWKHDYKETAERLVGCGIAPRRPYLREPAVELLSREILAASLLHYKLRDHDGEFECLPEWRLRPKFLDRHCRNLEWRPDSTNTP